MTIRIADKATQDEYTFLNVVMHTNFVGCSAKVRKG